MPDEVAAPDTQEAPVAEPEAQPDDRPDGNDWFRETLSGRTTAPVESRPSRSQQWAEANAELRRARRPNAESGKEPEARTPAKPVPEAEETEQPEPPASRPERDETEFERRIQAEVDRREAVRTQRAEAQRERELRRTNPTEYAKLKEQQEANNAHVDNLTGALRMLSSQFDDAAVTPLVNAVPESVREAVLKDPGHGIEGRKEIVKRAIEALKKSSYDEGVKAGKDQAQKSLRRSTAFRKELLTQLRDEEDQPELASANGSAAHDGWDMNDWMRASIGRRGRPSRE